MRLEDIDLLLDLFRRLLELLNSVLPEKDPDKWAAAEKEAEIKLGQDMDRRKSMFTVRDDQDSGLLSEAEREELGLGPRKKSEKEIRAEKQIKQLITEIAERIYRQEDGDYAKAVADIEKARNDILKQLSRQLRAFRPALLQLSEPGNCPVAYSKDFFDSWRSISEHNRKHYIETAIEDLEGVKVVMERQQPVNTTHKQAGSNRKAAHNKKDPEGNRNFQPWKKSGDACFIIENNRIQFHYKSKIKDLRLKNESKTHKLLFMLITGNLQSDDIKKDLCSDKTSPYKVVAYANKTLNKKISQVGFADVPQDVEYIKYHKLFNSYELALKIWLRDDFDRQELQQPLVADRRFEDMDDAENSC